MADLPYSQIQKGTFLIATPDIEFGIFYRSVVLVCEHASGGSFGLIINKNLDFEFPEDVIDIQKLSNPRIGMRAGGPVQPNQMMLLHTNNHLVQNKLEICEGVFLGGDLQFLQDSIIDENGPAIQLCFGYSGWGAGQLEREFLNGHWFIHPASLREVFYIKPEKLWSTLLREMGGKYASISTIPEDLSVN